VQQHERAERHAQDELAEIVCVHGAGRIADPASAGEPVDVVTV
jgi:hypothetical protein